MASVNKVTLVGNLGKDPQVRGGPGTFVVELSIATTYRWKDKITGKVNEEVEWHAVVLFGSLADIASQYLKKGRPVYIEGRITTNEWYDDAKGEKRQRKVIIATDMQMLGGGARDSAAEGAEGATGDQREQPSNAPDEAIPF